MIKTLHVVVSCTNRKRAAPPPALLARSLPDIDTRGRVVEWVRRLRETRSREIEAQDLYQGEHWHVARSLSRLTTEFAADCKLWICSAGYGLIRADARLKPYSASFAFSDEDAVARSAGRAATWWSELTARQNVNGAASWSFARLAKHAPAATVLVAASPSYLRPLTDDLLAAVRELRSPEQLWLISSGMNGTGPLSPYLLPSDARLQSYTGGTRQALNARVTKLIFSQAAAANCLARGAIVAWLRELLVEAPTPTVFKRTPLTDAEVRAFIQQRPRIPQTRLLRQLRDAGMACEQSRFRRIYRETTGGS